MGSASSANYTIVTDITAPAVLLSAAVNGSQLVLYYTDMDTPAHKIGATRKPVQPGAGSAGPRMSLLRGGGAAGEPGDFNSS